jgi:hypothetical protein
MSQNVNYHKIRYGTAEGEIKFGHVHTDNVRSAVMLRSGHTYEHYMTMDGPGGKKFRKHSTNFRGPGAFQVKHGKGVPNDEPGIFLDAESGDVVIRASNGRIRLEALDIDITATGGDGENGKPRGNIQISATDKVITTGNIIDCKAVVAAKFFSNKSVEVCGEGVLNMYGGLTEWCDGSTSIVGSKTAASQIPVVGSIFDLLGTSWEKQMKFGYAANGASLFTKLGGL